MKHIASIHAAGASDIGRMRTNNEDSFLVDDALRLYIVADGIGGRQSGEMASKLVVDIMRDYFRQSPGSDCDKTRIINDDTLTPEANQLLSGIVLANRGIYDLSEQQDQYRQMGSTVAAVVLTEATLIAANVGDSPIYLIHGDRIESLSVTHNVETELAAINPEKLNRIGKTYRTMLTRAVGIADSVDPHICETPFFKDDRIILCSDGLSNKVSLQEIILAVTTQRPGSACNNLIKLANDRGGEDNITIVIIHLMPDAGIVNRFIDFFSKIRYGVRKLFSFALSR
jgi:protein phosphatase